MHLPFYMDALFGAVLGAVFGSFISATVWAWLRNRKNSLKRSICDKCGQQLPALALIPVFGFILLKGKCHICGRKIPLFHFVMEIIPACLGWLIGNLYGIGLLSLCYIILASGLTAASAVDFLCRRLPDFITLGSLALLPPVLAARPELSPAAALAGYLIGGGLPLGLFLAFKYLRHKQAIGLGDVKLFALAGAFLDPFALPLLFLLSAGCGIVILVGIAAFTRKPLWSYRLPFGPCICASFLLLLLFPAIIPAFYAFIPALC